ncbi:hypothetical protein BOTBODRAFT_171934 [Botryobasidium botryosum FD-172 SS1]|uniref:Uncharacterized protein n=1 Tax=Botryobasidium botryosum (strain FD-172 SS1) TaxID=930990 RepID=A0A067MZY1_BOTB1|nr:hypothetical protein BOTBODRAFT_171934 [Botryobasidium botryosum FD-172 SS1]
MTLITQTISKLEYCMQLTFLVQIHTLAKAEHSNKQYPPCMQLQPFFTKRVPTTFNTLWTLQHKASSTLVYSRTSMPRVWWTDKVNWSSMLYKGDQVYLDSIHNMFAKLEQDIWDNWKDNILWGVCLDPIALGDLTEDLTR